jgi:DNA-binding transcriptional regulator YhcF (GntR family)
MLGTARQTLSREFNTLAEAGYIKLEHGNIVIVDAQALENCSPDAEDFFTSFSD